jgi:exodeoxyribonuclease V gamma subunit
MFILHHGNRLEALADELARLLAEAPADPLQAEVIITQSRGMARWLSLRLAQRLGVAANLRFPLPGAFVWDVLQAHTGGGAAPGYTREALAWRVLRLLPGLLSRPAFASLAHDLTDSTDERRVFQLARQIADVFDQYLVFRWPLVLDWEAGAAPDDWQAELWRALAAEDGDTHHRARLFRCLKDLAPDPALLPARLAVFGMNTLPPAYLDVLEWLAPVSEVHLFLPNPCREYWGDIEDHRTLERWRVLRPGRALHQEVGHPLLASLGKQGRDFLQLLYEGDRALEEREHFVEPGDDSLLHRIQGDLLDLRPSVETETSPDFSIQFHVCHGPLREVQVLHDRLLDRFERDPSLRPGDVVVMVPAIERYAPYVEAVFAVGRGGTEMGAAPRLPCAIADRTARGEHLLLDAFLRLLDLPDSRLGAAEVFEWLETPAIRARFELAIDDLETLRRWIAESGIRWGLDGASKRAWTLPEEPTHTWRFGLDRLLLGYAMAPGVDLYAGIAPYPDVEGQQAEALGRLVRFVDCLETFRGRLARRHSISAWLSVLNDLCATFFLPGDDDEPAMQILRDALDALLEATTEAAYADETGLPVIADFLRGHLEEPHHAGGFLTGRITFCSLMPMRGIPFQVVCLLGMNDLDYPRRRVGPGFDLIARQPRLGDRSRREDDRYLFLEALLSARETLYVSYVGRGDRDNSERQASVLVRELQETVAERLGLPFKRDGQDRTAQLKALGLIVEHPLQPFSRRYFDGGDPRLFSYAGLWAQRAEATPPFCSGDLAEPPDPVLLEADLETLMRFFRNPAAWFLRNRLDLRFGEEAEVLEEAEPFSLDRLSLHQLTDRAIERILAGDLDEGLAFETLKAQGRLPQGIFGELEFRAVRDAALAFAERLTPHLPVSVEALPPIRLDVDDLHFSARFARVGPTGLVRYRTGKLRPQDRLDAWLHHLALQLATDDGERRRSLFVAQDTMIAYPPLETGHAQSALIDLLVLHRQGMNGPLPFFPRASYAYAEAVHKGKPEDAAFASALKCWLGDSRNHRPGEGEDAAIATAFRGQNPFAGELGTRFQDLALRVFGPLLAALE